MLPDAADADEEFPDCFPLSCCTAVPDPVLAAADAVPSTPTRLALETKEDSETESRLFAELGCAARYKTIPTIKHTNTATQASIIQTNLGMDRL